MKKLLLLGGNGFIGKNLQEILTKHNINYYISDLTYNNKLCLNLADNSQIYKLIPTLNNITDIVILACTVGTQTYINNPITSYLNSINIINNISELLIYMHKTYNKKYNIIYFSSSDVYINTSSLNDYITELTPIKVDINRNIALYGEVKIIGETLFNTLLNNKIIKSLKILRPFNISGKYQYQGVLYEMLKSAITLNQITYLDNTTRVITSTEYLCELFITILNDQKTSLIKNVCDNNGSMSLKTLAFTLKNILISKNICKNINIHKLKNPSNNNFRHTGILQTSPNNYILNIVEQILNHDKIN